MNTETLATWRQRLADQAATLDLLESLGVTTIDSDANSSNSRSFPQIARVSRNAILPQATQAFLGDWHANHHQGAYSNSFYVYAALPLIPWWRPDSTIGTSIRCHVATVYIAQWPERRTEVRDLLAKSAMATEAINDFLAHVDRVHANEVRHANFEAERLEARARRLRGEA